MEPEQLRELIDTVNNQGTLKEAFEIQVDFEPVEDEESSDYKDDAQDIIGYAKKKYNGQAWQVVNTDSGEVMADYEGYDAAEDPKKGERAGFFPGEIEKRDKVEEPEQDDFEDQPKISGTEARRLAFSVADKIGELFPDGDPADAIAMVLRKAGYKTGPDLFDIDDEVSKVVRDQFELQFGDDIYGYYNDILSQMQGDDPNQFGDYTPLEEAKRIKGQEKSVNESFRQWKRKL